MVFYPACGMKGQFADGIKPYAPVRVFQGSADEEVSPKRCADLVAKSRTIGGDVQFQLYPDATHDFDDPNPSHQSDEANASATRDAITRAIAFFASVLKP
jgi:dienelactone hydrolase